jgi:DNA topoisomerase-1
MSARSRAAGDLARPESVATRLLADAEASAELARLRYVDVDEPGIERRRRGRSFGYRHADGTRVSDAATLARIRALVIPPAWTQVWICRTADGHIQATGRDARGRKQYRYHPRWRALRDAAKFEHMLDFAVALAAIRRRVDADLRRQGLTRERVLATVVRLLDRTNARIGNESYARDNGSYGLVTLRCRHASVSGSTVELAFRGKSGVRRRLVLDDRKLAAVVRRCQELPGQRLFRWVDDRGVARDIESGDVNRYLREASGREVTSKDFRTWAATVTAASALHELGPRPSKARRARCVRRAIERTAHLLGNTPAVCKRSYIHPAVIGAYVDGSLCDALAASRARLTGRRMRGLGIDERVLVDFLAAQQRALVQALAA